jgi:hypothetical protein
MPARCNASTKNLRSHSPRRSQQRAALTTQARTSRSARLVCRDAVADRISQIDAVPRGGVAAVSVARVGVRLSLPIHSADGLIQGRVPAAVLGHPADLGEFLQWGEGRWATDRLRE